MTVTMTPDVAKALREPFPAEVIGKLPRVYCRACSDAKRGGGTCQNHQKRRCNTCGNNITEAHLHLDYVGHAETTDRFLAVDPWWTWEPLAFAPDGLPLLDRSGGLWIRLTIAGVTRLGYGHANGKEGPDAIKEAIGDALRNGGMRFGVALDLWGAKFKDGAADDHHEPEQEPEPTPAQVAEYDEFAKRIAAAEAEETLKAVWADLKAAFGAAKVTTVQANELRGALDKRKSELAEAAA
jgi:hypothetical protein